MRIFIALLTLFVSLSVFGQFGPTVRTNENQSIWGIKTFMTNAPRSLVDATHPDDLVKFSQISGGGINATTATNIINAISGVIGTNGANLTFNFSPTGTNDILSIVGSATNISSGTNHTFWYVSQLRGNDSWPGTINQPKKNLMALVPLLRGKTNVTIWCEPGVESSSTYTDYNGFNGGSGITFGNFANVKIYGNGLFVSATNQGYILTATNFSDYLIDGLGFTYSSYNPTNEYTNIFGAVGVGNWPATDATMLNQNLTIQNCIFLNCPDQAITIGPGFQSTKGVKILNNRFYNIGTTNLTGVGGDGAVMSGFWCNDATVRGNYASNVQYFVEFDARPQNDGSDWRNIIVSENTVEYLRGRFFISTATQAGTTNSLKDIQIINNQVTSSGEVISSAAISGHGGRVLLSENTFSGFINQPVFNWAVFSNDVESIEIFANKFLRCPQPITIAANSNNLPVIKTAIINNNIFEGHTIAMVLGARSVTMTGNSWSNSSVNAGYLVVAMNGLRASSVFAGLRGDCTNFVFTDNRWHSIRSSDGLSRGWVGTAGTLSVSNAVFVNNWDYTLCPKDRLFSDRVWIQGAPFGYSYVNHVAFGDAFYGQSPNGVMYAGQGSVLVNALGVTNTTVFYKESNNETNIGWGAVITSNGLPAIIAALVASSNYVSTAMLNFASNALQAQIGSSAGFSVSSNTTIIGRLGGITNLSFVGTGLTSVDSNTGTATITLSGAGAGGSGNVSMPYVTNYIDPLGGGGGVNGQTVTNVTGSDLLVTLHIGGTTDANDDFFLMVGGLPELALMSGNAVVEGNQIHEYTFVFTNGNTFFITNKIDGSLANLSYVQAPAWKMQVTGVAASFSSATVSSLTASNFTVTGNSYITNETASMLATNAVPAVYNTYTKVSLNRIFNQNTSGFASTANNRFNVSQGGQYLMTFNARPSVTNNVMWFEAYAYTNGVRVDPMLGSGVGTFNSFTPTGSGLFAGSGSLVFNAPPGATVELYVLAYNTNLTGTIQFDANCLSASLTRLSQ